MKSSKNSRNSWMPLWIPLVTAAQAFTSVAYSGQAQVNDNVSQRNIVQIASANKDFTTLVTALQAADLVDSVANPGPFTVFAPTNAAFDKLPKGTVDGLLKPAKKEELQHILEHHVFVGVLSPEQLKDGMVLNQVSGENATIKVKGGKRFFGNAEIVGSVRASNGIIHVVDSVVVPSK